MTKYMRGFGWRLAGRVLLVFITLDALIGLLFYVLHRAYAPTVAIWFLNAPTLAVLRIISIFHPEWFGDGAGAHFSTTTKVIILSTLGLFSGIVWAAIAGLIFRPTLMPNHLLDPTSPSVTPPAGAGGAPSVAADH